MFRQAVWSLGGIALFFFSAAPCFSMATTPTEPSATKVIILSNGSCCKERAWLAAETAVFEELESIHLQVQVVPWMPPSESVEASPLSGEALKTTLVTVGEQNGATVVVYLERAPEGGYRADISAVHPGASAKFEQLHFPKDNHPDEVQTAALQIVETVNALITQAEVASAAISPVKTKPAPDNGALPRKKEVDRYRVGIGLGVASAFSPGGVLPSVGIDANINVTFATYLLFECDLFWALYTKDISHNDESATFDMVLVRGRLYWNIVPGGKIHPAVGLGAGVVITKSDGRSEPEAGLENVKEKQVVSYLGASARLAIDISPHTAFLLNFNGGFLAPHVDIVLNEQLAATFGLPLLELMAGFEFRFL